MARNQYQRDGESVDQAHYFPKANRRIVAVTISSVASNTRVLKAIIGSMIRHRVET